ncbi:MAG: Hsp70 family protein [Deltaproteobacteria bacterium]|nr:Hsp70 family protein [Deltaproteobacteria bacterium]
MSLGGKKNGVDTRPSVPAIKPNEPIIGIDLGTTSVVAAYVPSAGEQPRVIPGEKGQASLPAVVGFRAGKSPVVGRAALEMLTTAPKHTVSGIKRLLGRKFSSQAVKDLGARVGFTIVEGAEGEAAIEIDGKRLSVPEVASLLLAEIKRNAEAHLKGPVQKCVIAVPAYFNDAQKSAVRLAAQRAGLEVLKLVHEPTAVALAYGYDKGGDARIVILDMGGIRLDVSAMEITGNVFDVVATGGDAYLGGLLLDARITEWILGNIKKKYGKDLTTEPALLTKVRTAAEMAKRELSRFRAVDLQIPLNTAKGDKREIGVLRFTLETVERLAADLVDRAVGLATHVLQERNLSPADIDDVILVGGATRMPLLKSRVNLAFNKEPQMTLPPEEVIAFGAALLADSLKREAQVETVKQPIGIALSDGRFMKIIDKDSRVPITRRVMIPTVRDHQRVLEIDFFQGDSEDLLDTEYLGTVVYRGLPDAKAGEAKVVVDLVLGPERLLSVTSPDPGREGEKFELKTLAARSEPDEAPHFMIAQSMPEIT